MKKNDFQKKEKVTFVGDYSQCDEKYKQKLCEIDALRRIGDFDLISEMKGITVGNVKMAYVRVGSKHHESVIEALEGIIENRVKMLNSSENGNN